MTRPAEKTPREVAEDVVNEWRDGTGALIPLIERALRAERAAAFREAAKKICPFCRHGLNPEGEWHALAFVEGRVAQKASCAAAAIHTLAAREDGHE